MKPITCTVCKTTNPPESEECSECGYEFNRVDEGDKTGGLIPYKNPPALIAYYLGLLSFLPVLGLFLGVTAVILGRKGLRRARENPAIKGVVHAWIGIGCGGIFAVVWVVWTTFIVYAIVTDL